MNIRKLFLSIFLTLFISPKTFALDLSQFKYNSDEISKKHMNYLKAKGIEYRSLRAEMMKDILISINIRDEVGRLKKMNLSNNELKLIARCEDLSQITRIAALRILMKREGERILPFIIELFEMYKERWTEPNYNYLVNHLRRLIVEIELNKYDNCISKINLLLDLAEKEETKTGVTYLFPAYLDSCKGEKGIKELLWERYKKGNVNKKHSILIYVSSAKLSYAKEFIDEALKSKDSIEIVYGATACQIFYNDGCITRLKEVANNINGVEREVIEKMIKNYKGPDFVVGKHFLEEHPITYGE